MNDFTLDWNSVVSIVKYVHTPLVCTYTHTTTYIHTYSISGFLIKYTRCTHPHHNTIYKNFTYSLWRIFTASLTEHLRKPESDSNGITVFCFSGVAKDCLRLYPILAHKRSGKKQSFRVSLLGLNYSSCFASFLFYRCQ